MTKKQTLCNRFVIWFLFCLSFLFSCESEKEEKIIPVSKTGLTVQKVIFALKPTDQSDKPLAQENTIENHLTEKLDCFVETTIPLDSIVFAESFRLGEIDLAYLKPRDALRAIDEKTASALLVRLPEDNPEKSIWLCRKDKKFSNISEVENKAIAFANRSSDAGYLIPIWDLKRRNLIGSDRALTDFFSLVIYGDDFESVVKKVLNGELEALAASSHAFDSLSGKLKSDLRIFQEQGGAPTEVLCIRSSISAADRKIIGQAILEIYTDDPELAQRTFQGLLGYPDEAHLKLTRESLQAIKAVKP
jgi:ABC-type phosphate/phosphonate transport system substrate-binding protein